MHFAQEDRWLSALNDPDWHRRATAVRMLGESEPGKPAQRVEWLLTAIDDGDESVRAAAVWALGKLGELAPVERVVEATHDRAWRVREIAALTLGVLGHRDRISTEPLTALARNRAEDALVREAAAMALQQTSPKSLEVLASHASDGATVPPSQGQYLYGTTPHPRQPFSWSTARRIAEGVLAVALVAGIALSWFALARTLRPAASHPSPVLASPTISPSWTGHNLNTTVVDGVVYVGALNQAVYALRASDGSLLWRYTIAGAASDTPPLVVHGIVYINATALQDNGSQIGAVYALRANDGSLLWRFTRDSSVNPPVVSNDVAYIASGDGVISALRANTGSLLWRSTVSGFVNGPPLLVNATLYISTRASASSDNGQGHLYALRASDGVLLWRFSGTGPISTPAVIDGIVYLSSEYGLAALHASDGSPLWQYAPAATAFSSLVVSNGTVFATGTAFPPNTMSSGGYLLQVLPMMPLKMLNSTLYAVRASDGNILWRYKMTGGTLLAINGGTVYLTTPASQTSSVVSALRSSDGSLLWRFATDDAPMSIVIVGGVVYIGADGALYALQKSDGSLLWRISMYGAVYNTPVLAGGMIYVGTTSGYVYALRTSDGSLLWRYLTDVSQ